MTIKEFKEYIKLRKVRKQSPNISRSKALMEESEEKYKYLLISIKSIKKEQINPNVITDQCYDIIMELIRAKMHLDGYNAGSSHEAEVSYLKVLGFGEPDIRFMDELRYYRNGIKYYGTKLDITYAEKIIEFTKRITAQLKTILKNR